MNSGADQHTRPSGVCNFLRTNPRPCMGATSASHALAVHYPYGCDNQSWLLRRVIRHKSSPIAHRCLLQPASLQQIHMSNISTRLSEPLASNSHCTLCWYKDRGITARGKERNTFFSRWNTSPGACTMSRLLTAGSPLTLKSGSFGSARQSVEAHCQHC
jgi:hypothetical protein